MKRLLLNLLLLAAPISTAHAKPQVIDCELPWAASVMAPLEAGPAQLVSVQCVRTDFGRSGRLRPDISPDGTAFLAPDFRSAMVRDLKADATEVITAFEAGTEFGPSRPLAWSSDSKSVWGTARGEFVPGKFPVEQLRTFRLWRDGRREDLPPLAHEAGWLDQLYWADGSGLAVAEFGRINHRPQGAPKSSDPIIAIVDALHGQVLQAIPLSRFGQILGGRDDEKRGNMVRIVTARPTPDGRVRVVLRGREGWLLWTQGEEPRALALPYEYSPGGIWPHDHATLTEDGEHILVATTLQAFGAHCEYENRCAPPTPVTGVLAGLHDLTSGDALWTLSVTATHFAGWRIQPAIWADRLALIRMPPTPGMISRVALLDLRTGAVLQTFKPPNIDDFGFDKNGRAWISSGNLVAFYDVRR